MLRIVARTKNEDVALGTTSFLAKRSLHHLSTSPEEPNVRERKTSSDEHHVNLPMFTSTFSCVIFAMRLIVLGPGRRVESDGYAKVRV